MNATETPAVVEEAAECCWCRTKLRGQPYHKGGIAYLPLPKGGRAPVNYYGGYVCSRSCDYRASLDLEQSMPGHGFSQQKPGREAMVRIESNWGDE